MRVVIINGYPTSGKDTFVEMCNQYCDVENILTSTPAKDALRLLGWNGEKTEEARYLLSYLMDLSYINFDGPVNYVLEKIHDSKADLIFIHCREPYNIEKLKQNIIGRVITLFIERDIAKGDYNNHADNDVENYEYDLYIDNNRSLEKLDETAQNFVSIMLKGLY